jgi:predicted regulator of Ras-like GTPase activity (Roadblock/LC7/MglB family)
MERMSDYAALAQRVAAAVPGIRGCLLLSRDGMVLGAHPEGEVEAPLKAAWLRFTALGDADRSYVEFPDQTWAFVRRGGYAAFAVADVGVRPGVLVDLLEQVLMAGEVERAHDRETMRVPEAPVAPSGKPRTSLHKPERAPAPPPEPVAVRDVRSTDVVAADAGDPAVPGDGQADGDVADAEPPTEADRPRFEPDDDSEVDRILLAKEFAGLLQVPKDDDEASR